MRRFIRALIFTIVVACAIGLFVIGFLAYSVISTGPDGARDGLGRPLTECPYFAQIFLGRERLWPGWRWFAIDSIAFFGGLGVLAAVAKLAGAIFADPDLEKSQPTPRTADEALKVLLNNQTSTPKGDRWQGHNEAIDKHSREPDN